METRIEKWLLKALRKTKRPSSSPRLLIIDGPLGSGKSSLAASISAKFCTNPFDKKVVYVAPAKDRSKLQRNWEVTNIPLNAEFTLETVTSSALNILRSDIAVAQGRPGLDSTRLLFSRSEMNGYLASSIYSLPQSRFRPSLAPTSYVPRLAECFDVLDKCEVSSSSLRSWLDNASEANSLETLIFKDLCEVFDAYHALKNARNVMDLNDCILMGKRILEKASEEKLPLPSISRSVWGFECDLFVIDDFHLYPPNQARLLGTLGMTTSNATLILCDKDERSSDRYRSRTASTNNLEFLVKRFGGKNEAISLKSRSTLIAKNVPIDNHHDEIAALKGWLAFREKDAQQEPVVIATVDENDRDEIVALLNTRLGPEWTVKALGVWRHLLDSDEVRGVMFFLNAVLRGPTDSADRELYGALTSELFGYSPSAQEIALLGELRTRQFLTMREALKQIESGKTLLRDLETIQNFAIKGRSLSQLTVEILGLAGISAASPAKRQSLDVSNLVDFLQFIIQLETKAGSSASAIDILGQLDQRAVLGNDMRIEDDQSGPRFASWKENNTLAKVVVATMGFVCNEFPAASINHLLLVRADADKLPSKFRRFSLPLPWQLLRSARPNDQVDESGPFLDDTLEGRLGHQEAQKRILRALRARSKDMMLYYSCSANQLASPLFHEEQSISQGDIASSTTKVVLSKNRPTALKGSRNFSTMARQKEVELDVITLSHSRMVEFETCPKRYYFSRVLGLQAPSNPWMVYGKALHSAIETHYLEKIDEAKLSSACNSFVSSFQSELNGGSERGPRPQGFLSRGHIDDVREAGIKCVERFHQRWLQNILRDDFILVERRFQLFWEEAKISVVGVIDLVERVQGENALRIVDFKSNMSDHAKLRRLAKDNSQLELYSWAYETEFGERAKYLAIESIETGERVETLVPSIETVHERLLRVAQRIRNQDYEATPSYGACMFCPFKCICPDAHSRL